MAAAAPPDPGPDGLRLEIGRATVPANSAAAVAAAVERSNAALRLADLPDALNPEIIDAAKASAFIAALAKLPETALAPLAGHSIYLKAPGLPLRTTSPTTPDGVSRLAGMEVVDLQGDTAMTRALLPPDCGLAQSQADSARAAMADIEKVVADLSARREAAVNGPDETNALHVLSAARSRRFAIASAWLENATAIAACRPDDARARADLEAARQAVHASAVPSGGGMG